eukprot:COSAG03_NODE_1314_length_4344_cov_3.035807_2_plen_203_part_00
MGSHCRTVLAAAPEKSCSPSLKPTIVAVLRWDSTLSTMSSGMPGFTRLTLKNSEPAETFAARRRSDRSTQRSGSPLSPHSDDPPVTPPAGRRPSSLACGTRRQQRTKVDAQHGAGIRRLHREQRRHPGQQHSPRPYHPLLSCRRPRASSPLSPPLEIESASSSPAFVRFRPHGCRLAPRQGGVDGGGRWAGSPADKCSISYW